jgi:hypothetical protein
MITNALSIDTMTARGSRDTDVGLFIVLAGCPEVSEVLDLSTDDANTGNLA